MFTLCPMHVLTCCIWCWNTDFASWFYIYIEGPFFMNTRYLDVLADMKMVKSLKPFKLSLNLNFTFQNKFKVRQIQPSCFKIKKNIDELPCSEIFFGSVLHVMSSNSTDSLNIRLNLWKYILVYIQCCL